MFLYSFIKNWSLCYVNAISVVSQDQFHHWNNWTQRSFTHIKCFGDCEQVSFMKFFGDIYVCKYFEWITIIVPVVILKLRIWSPSLIFNLVRTWKQACQLFSSLADLKWLICLSNYLFIINNNQIKESGKGKLVILGRVKMLIFRGKKIKDEDQIRSF